MSTQDAQHVAETAQQVGERARQEGGAVAETVADQARAVSGVVGDQAGRVAGEALDQAGSLLASASSHLEEQAEEQAHKLADVLRTASDQARALADGRTEQAGDTDRYVRQVAGTLGQIAERIDRLGARGSLEEVQEFARRRPGAFLAGAAAAGLLSSRILRSVDTSGGGSRQTADRSRTRQIPASTAGDAPVGPVAARPPGSLDSPSTTSAGHGEAR